MDDTRGSQLNPSQVIIRFLGFNFSHAQLITQVSIASERFVAVKFPIKYRNHQSKLNRKIVSIVIWIVSALFSIAVTLPSLILGYPRVIGTVCCATYTISLILVTEMYLMTTLEVRKAKKRVQKTRNPRRDGRDQLARARSHENETLILSAAIVGAYFTLNTTLIVYTAFYEGVEASKPMLARSCYTTDGKLAHIAIGLASLNKLVDPLMYFYLKFYMNRRKQGRIENIKINGTADARVDSPGKTE